MAAFDNPCDVGVPEEYRSHVLVEERVFYVLPQKLLDALVARFKQQAFDPQRIEMEQRMTGKLAGHPQLVGYRSGEAFSCSLMPVGQPFLWDASEEQLSRVGMTRQTWNLIRKEGAAKMAPMLDTLRGYCGWLVTNPDYLKERDTLFDTWRSRLATDGIPQSGPTFFGKMPLSDFIRAVSDEEEVRFLKDFERFYARWRLQHLITRELPEPLGPQIPVLTPLALLTHMRTGGVTLYQPDTMPIPSRDRLREVLEGVRVSHENEHLKEWIAMVAANRYNDHSIRCYGQIFVLHFYWTVFEERHPKVMTGNIGRIQEAFADYLAVSAEAVKKYRDRIRERLGPPPGVAGATGTEGVPGPIP